MKRLLLLAGALLLLAGCASIPKTTTYQVAEWQQVEEPQPALQKVVVDTATEEEIEVAQPPRTVVVQADIPQKFPGAKKGRKYLNIGYKPVNPNRALAPGEVEFILPVDTYVETIDRDGKHVRGWLLAGERVIGVSSSDPDLYKAIWIRRCGNDLFNEEKIAIFIRVKKEVVAQPPVKVKRPKVQQRVETVSQPPIKRWVPVAVTKTRELTCRERKAEVSWWRKGLSYVVTGVVGTGGALIGGKVGGPYGTKIGAGIGVAAGRLIGGYTDGSECIDGGDVAEAVLLGSTAAVIAPMNARPAPAAHVGGPSNPPPNGPVGPAPLPPNGPAPVPPPVISQPIGGPAVLPSNGPAPLPPNGPSFFPGS